MPRIPDRDPAVHRDYLVEQIRTLQERVADRDPAGRAPGASRELIAIQVEPESDIAEQSLADKRSDVKLVSFDDDTQVVLLDAPTGELKHLVSKAEHFGDDTKVTKKTGKRASERAIAPIATIALAETANLSGPRYRSTELVAGNSYWFELACRGGVIPGEEPTETSRSEIQHVLGELGFDGAPQEFVAAERLMVYLRLTDPQLRSLVDRTDCIYEFDLLAPELRTWLILNQPTAPTIEDFVLSPPDEHAASVVLLDTGIAPDHPLLKQAVLSATSVVPNDTSPDDVEGHGTQLAGIALYDELIDAVDRGEHTARHWLQSARILIGNGVGSASEDDRPYWPATTTAATESAIDNDPNQDRVRAFVLATAADNPSPGAPTSWSAALDELAYSRDTLIAVSAGNCHVDLAIVGDYPRENLTRPILDPAQSVNAITVGGYTTLCALSPDLPHHAAVAGDGGVSPNTTAGIRGQPIKPDIVLEAGNVGFDGALPNVADTMVRLTTSHDYNINPFSAISGTSCAAALAGQALALISNENPALTSQTLRGLLVHSSRWTAAMMNDLPDLDDRLSLCGYGVPNIVRASLCARERATVVFEDDLANAIEGEDGKLVRPVKMFQLPIPTDELEALGDAQVELSVTLSYFTQPHLVRGRLHHGLDLQWDMQGPTESDDEFRKRINRLHRTEKGPAKTESFPWIIGKQKRSRGTVQSDRWTGPATFLGGTKWLAVYPVLGWWDQRLELRRSSMPFSLIVTVDVPQGTDIYTPISLGIEVPVTVDAS